MLTNYNKQQNCCHLTMKMSRKETVLRISDRNVFHHFLIIHHTRPATSNTQACQLLIIVIIIIIIINLGSADAGFLLA